MSTSSEMDTDLEALSQQQIFIGESRVFMLQIGQDSDHIKTSGFLPICNYSKGEPVSVIRSSGRRTIAVISYIGPEFLVLKLGNLLEKQVPAADVPGIISKLIGPYFVESIRVVPAEEMLEFKYDSEYTFLPCILGRPLLPQFFITRVQSNYYFENELVGICRRGSWTFGKITRISVNSVEVISEFASSIYIPISEFHLQVGKFLMPHYEITMKENPPMLLSNPVTTIQLGETILHPLKLGQDCSNIVLRTNRLPVCAFSPNEFVGVRLHDSSPRFCFEVVEVRTGQSLPLRVRSSNGEEYDVSEIDVCKLEGNFFYIEKGPVFFVQFDARGFWKVGKSHLRPLYLGQVDTSIIS